MPDYFSINSRSRASLVRCACAAALLLQPLLARAQDEAPAQPDTTHRFAALHAWWEALSGVARYALTGVSWLLVTWLIGGCLLGGLLYQVTENNASVAVRWGYMCGTLLWMAMAGLFMWMVLQARDPIGYIILFAIPLILCALIIFFVFKSESA